jgi:hypothetical protein
MAMSQPGAQAPAAGPSAYTQQGNPGFPLPNIRRQIPPQLQQAFDAFVLGCKRVLYDPKTHYLLQQQLQGPGTLAQKLGQGVVALVLLVYSQHGKPVQLTPILIPAAVELVGDVSVFLRQSMRIPVNRATYGQAVQIATGTLLRKMPPAVAQAIQRQRGGAAPAARGAPGPAMAPATASTQQPQALPGPPIAGAAQPPGGLLARTMPSPTGAQ